MNIYFATNRNPDNVENPTAFGKDFSTNGLTDLRFGKAVFDGDSYELHVAKENLQVPEEAAAAHDFSGQVLGSQSLFSEIQKRMRKEKRDAVIFIHGYGVSFDKAVRRTRKLADAYGDKDLIWILFSWPSDGSKAWFKAYKNDRVDAAASGAAMSRALQKLASFLRRPVTGELCKQNVHIMAHSMGNYALRHAVQDVKKSAGSNIRRLFTQVLLVAADEDDDAFELDHKLVPLIDMAERLTVYCDPGDAALMISDSTKGNPDRLGASGPRNPRLLRNKVTVVNVKQVTKWDGSVADHSYHADNKYVVEDILKVLDGDEDDDFSKRKFSQERSVFFLKK
ncbi:MAG: alpha/beta hydrolase [Pseudomonadota bacterium]